VSVQLDAKRAFPLGVYGRSRPGRTALSTAVPSIADTEEVTGSNPVAPVLLHQVAARWRSDTLWPQVCAASATVWLDPDKVERIVEELLANTTRHTPPGTPVWVRAHRQGTGLLLVVEDAGPGVPTAMRTSVFERFRHGETAQLCPWPRHRPLAGAPPGRAAPRHRLGRGPSRRWRGVPGHPARTTRALTPDHRRHRSLGAPPVRRKLAAAGTDLKVEDPAVIVIGPTVPVLQVDPSQSALRSRVTATSRNPSRPGHPRELARANRPRPQ
jgi:hypothetical protein